MINFLKLRLTNVLLIIAFVIPCLSYAQKKIQKRIAHIAEQVGIPGMQVAYVKKGKVNLYEHGVHKYGTTDVVNKYSRFQAASLTKVVATYAFFRLMDKGVIDLDEPLWNYYPYDRLKKSVKGHGITARMVLTHRSGLLNWQGDVPSATWRATPLTVQFDPGSDYMYSGEGFYFLQETLEHITKKSFQNIVEEEVFKPLGLTYSNIVWNDTLEKHAAYGHYEFNKPRRLGKYAKTNAAYTLYTTASDYARFVQLAIIEGKGLKKTTHKLMLKKAAEAKKGESGDSTDRFVPCALGLRMQLNEKGVAYWHTGSNPGFRCFFITYPKQKETLVAFMNTDTGFPAMKQLMQLFLDNKQTFWAYDWREGELD